MTEIGKLNDVCNVVSCSNNEAITLTTYDYKQCKVDKKKKCYTVIVSMFVDEII